MSSIDLVVKSDLNGSVQTVQDQNGNNSALAIGTSNVSVGTTKEEAPLTVQSPGTKKASVAVLNKDGTMVASLREGGTSNGNLILYNTEGTATVQLIAGTGKCYFSAVNTMGIGTDNPQALLHVNGEIMAESLNVNNLSMANIQPSSSAPDTHRLEALFIDTETGMLYYQ